MVSSHDLVSDNFDVMDGWLNHVHGAMRLLELRGVEQLNSNVGVELFTTIRLQNVGILFVSNLWSRLIYGI